MKRTAAFITLFAVLAFAPSALGASTTKGDFDGDGVEDVAIGVPNEDVVNEFSLLVTNAGGVNVIYGRKSEGLQKRGDQFISQASEGIVDDAEIDDRFGDALASGDFDDDGFTDLAVGAEEEDTGVPGDEEEDGGEVQIIYGSKKGLTKKGDHVINDEPASFDQFGFALAAGDFNGDGFADLGVGSPNRSANAEVDSGALFVHYGAGTGLNTASQRIAQGEGGVIDDGPEGSDFDHLGSSLASGDFNGDGFADLAAGEIDDDILSNDNAGAVLVVYGSLPGLIGGASQEFNEGSGGVEGQAEDDDNFGEALAAGDFDRDGNADLAISAPGEDFSATNDEDTGIVRVLYGVADSGLGTGDDQGFSQDTAGVGGPSDSDGGNEDDDRFGDDLAAGDFDKDGAKDLAVGVPAENGNAGHVHVLFGVEGSSLTATGSQLWTQIPLGLAIAESGDRFGSALAVGDFDKDRVVDLAVGANGETFADGLPEETTQAGLVHAVYGRKNTGLVVNGNQLWTQASPGIADDPEEGDQFGFALGAGA